MTRDEFLSWLTDFARRFPQTAEWLRALPSETRELWYADVFAAIELRDAIAVNQMLMRGAGEIEAWQRERIPSIFIRRAQELRAERETKAQAANMLEESRANYGTRRSFDSGMRRCLARIEAGLRKYRSDHDGARMPDEQRDEVMSEELATLTHDSTDREPTYRCPTCRDSGWVSFRDDNGRPMTGACRCDRGKKREQAWNDRRKAPIGNPPLRCEKVNRFATEEVDASW